MCSIIKHEVSTNKNRDVTNKNRGNELSQRMCEKSRVTNELKGSFSLKHDHRISSQRQTGSFHGFFWRNHESHSIHLLTTVQPFLGPFATTFLRLPSSTGNPTEFSLNTRDSTSTPLICLAIHCGLTWLDFPPVGDSSPCDQPLPELNFGQPLDAPMTSVKRSQARPAPNLPLSVEHDFGAKGHRSLCSLEVLFAAWLVAVPSNLSENH